LEESINDGAQVQQLIHRGERSGLRMLAHEGSVVGPFGRDEGSSAVGQEQDPLLAVVSMCQSQDG
jgi:hypothetical protein